MCHSERLTDIRFFCHRTEIPKAEVRCERTPSTSHYSALLLWSALEDTSACRRVADFSFRSIHFRLQQFLKFSRPLGNRFIFSTSRCQAKLYATALLGHYMNGFPPPQSEDNA